jgi:hypothetical protein
MVRARVRLNVYVVDLWRTFWYELEAGCTIHLTFKVVLMQQSADLRVGVGAARLCWVW